MKWGPVKHKVWAATAGAMVMAGLWMYLLTRSLTGLTIEGMCVFFECPSRESELYLVIVYTAILAGIGAFIAGWAQKEGVT